MVTVHDDFFDQKWVSEVASQIVTEKWKPDNVANRKTFPSAESGTHRLLGRLFFYRHSNDYIEFDTQNMNLVKNLINAFDHIRKRTGLKMNLTEITGNLQFKGMDGTFHEDGPSNRKVFILMLCNERLPKNIGGCFIHQPTKKKVPFESGRMVEMTASDTHRAEAFNKPHFARMSLKWVGEIF